MVINPVELQVPSSVPVETTVDGSFTLGNDGEQTSSATVELAENGVTILARGVSIPAGGTENVDFDYTPFTAGTKELCVNVLGKWERLRRWDGARSDCERMWGVAVDPFDASIWYTYWNSRRIVHAERGGVTILQFSAPGFPWDIEVDPSDGTLWYADQRNNRIRHVERDGTGIDAFGTPDTDTRSITIDPGTGDIWVADNNTAKLYRLDRDGNILDTFATPFGINALSFAPGSRTLWATGSNNLVHLNLDGTEIQRFGGWGNVLGVGVDSEQGTLWRTRARRCDWDFVEELNRIETQQLCTTVEATAEEDGEPEPEPVRVRVTAIDAPEEVTVSNPVAPTVTVENIGDSEASAVVSLTSDESIVGEKTVTVAAGETRTVDFTWIPETPGAVVLCGEVQASAKCTAVNVVKPAPEEARCTLRGFVGSTTGIEIPNQVSGIPVGELECLPAGAVGVVGVASLGLIGTELLGGGE